MNDTGPGCGTYGAEASQGPDRCNKQHQSYYFYGNLPHRDKISTELCATNADVTVRQSSLPEVHSELSMTRLEWGI
jgi:hypothetical protein